MAPLTRCRESAEHVPNALMTENYTQRASAGNWQVWQTSLHNPDFSEYAKNCGGMGIRVTDECQLDEAIRSVLDYNGPSLIEVMTDAELI